MLHTLRNPQRFLCLGEGSHTEICLPGDSCICLPTCILHSLPRAVQTLPKQGTQLPPPLFNLPTDNWDREAEGSPSTPEGRNICYSAPNLENKKVATDNHIQQANSCFSLKPPLFPPHFSSQHNDPVLWVGICLPGHSHFISFVIFLMPSTEKADNTT